MRAALTTICAGLSALSAGIAWLLQMPPLPFIALSRWFDQQARHFKNPKQ